MTDYDNIILNHPLIVKLNDVDLPAIYDNFKEFKEKIFADETLSSPEKVLTVYKAELRMCRLVNMMIDNRYSEVYKLFKLKDAKL